MTARSFTCQHCGQPIQQINYSFGGKTWMHVEPNASFPTERKGTAWRHCKTQVAEPANDPLEDYGRRSS